MLAKLKTEVRNFLRIFEIVDLKLLRGGQGIEEVVLRSEEAHFGDGGANVQDVQDGVVVQRFRSVDQAYQSIVASSAEMGAINRMKDELRNVLREVVLKYLL